MRSAQLQILSDCVVIGLLKRLLKIEGIVYLIFGVLTTAGNWCICFLLHYKFQLSAAVSNEIAWVISVFFAYVTNKIFVFQSHSWSFKTTLPEMLKFYGGRFLTGQFETVLLSYTVDYLGLNVILWKLIAAVIVIVMNYVFSKLLIFNKKKT